MAKILVVDDDPIAVLAAQQFFIGEGYEVLAAGDGLSALDIARNERPDLIMLDLMLPKLDGFEVCNMLKSDEKFQSMKIIMFTGRKDEESLKTGREVGADAYLVKGCGPKRVLEEVHRLLKT